jgi:pyruvate,orthophosphate dikinase
VSTLPLLVALKVKGRATPEAVASAVGRDAADVRGALAALVAAGRATSDGDAFTLTPSGRAELRDLLRAEAVDRDALATAYDDAFLACDEHLKQAITAWQLAGTAPATPPRAADPRRAATLAEVRAAGRVAYGVAARVATILPRLAGYATRLEHALGRLADGDVRFVASPTVASLHQLWFELHEELLLVLGRERRA